MSAHLWEVWTETVGAAPHARALVDASTGATARTRETLYADAEKLSKSLDANVSGQVVATTQGNGTGWFVEFLALQRLGAVVLPLDASLPPERRVDTARKLGAAFLLEGNQTVPLGTVLSEHSYGPDVCLLKLTSGTGDAPRVLPFTAEQMLADAQQVCIGMSIGPVDLNFGAIPLGHSYALGNLVMPLVQQGTPLAISTETTPAALAAQIYRCGATVFPTVPAVVRALTESTSTTPGNLTSLRRVISAGAFLRPDVAIGFYTKFSTKVHNFYGSSETGGICFDSDGEATLSGRAVGRPLPGVRVELDAVVDDQIRVTSAAVTAPGSYLLADRGEWNEHGELRLRGRVGVVANVGGRKVDPAEVERTLRELPGVVDAWVGVRTRPGGDDYLVAGAETGLGRETILSLLAERLPAWQLPRQLLTTTALPRTPRGKLDRIALEQRFA